jgi:hypothetical protein
VYCKTYVDMSFLKIFIVALFVSVSFLAQAQTQPLVAKKNDAGLYIDHTVNPKEGIYAIGRLYNVHPKAIASFNKIDINKGLNIGEVLKVPLEAANFSQTATTGTPVYYVVGEKDGLMKVSNFANKLTLQKIRDWNQLSSDNLSVGQNLVIGYLQSAELAKVTPKQAVPVTKQVAAPPKEDTHPVETVKATIIEEPAKTEKIITKEVPKAEEVKPVVVKETPKQQVVTTPNTVVTTNPVSGDGYFASSFAAQVKQSAADNNETVTSGIFKTSSGWQDTKYYLLMDKLQAGKIVRITNPENNKTIYAKVLGEMSSIKQNQGLNVRISNAAAAALGIAENDKFIVNLNY